MKQLSLHRYKQNSDLRTCDILKRTNCYGNKINEAGGQVFLVWQL